LTTTENRQRYLQQCANITLWISSTPPHAIAPFRHVIDDLMGAFFVVLHPRVFIAANLYSTRTPKFENGRYFANTISAQHLWATDIAATVHG
jgi:hypothetical protein